MGLRRRRRRAEQAAAEAKARAEGIAADVQAENLKLQLAQAQHAFEVQKQQDAQQASQQALQTVAANAPSIQGYVNATGNPTQYTNPMQLAQAGAQAYGEQVAGYASGSDLMPQQDDGSLDPNGDDGEVLFDNDSYDPNELEFDLENYDEHELEIDLENFDMSDEDDANLVAMGHALALKDIKASPYFGKPDSFDADTLAAVLKLGGSNVQQLGQLFGKKPAASTPPPTPTPTLNNAKNFFKKNGLYIVIGIVLIVVVYKLTRKK